MFIGDLKFQYSVSSEADLGPADLVVSGNDLVQDATFETSVVITLGTNARADDSDVLPRTVNTRGGFWGSTLLGFELGCKLWLLEQSKLDQSTASLAEQYVIEGFDWMIEDGIASEVTCTATIAGANRLDLVVGIFRPALSDVEFSFYVNWESQLSGDSYAV